jgi:hypothetical protein
MVETTRRSSGGRRPPGRWGMVAGQGWQRGSQPELEKEELGTAAAERGGGGGGEAQPTVRMRARLASAVAEDGGGGGAAPAHDGPVRWSLM